MPFIASYERFSSIGGMLPEQVWDAPDMPEYGLYLGKSAGSAQPLVWAHAEYLKLLRSTKDGKIFDTIPVVEQRYAVTQEKRTFRSMVEIFQVARPITSVPSGFKLRVLDRERFELVYTLDDWKTVEHTTSDSVGFPGFIADIAAPALTDGAPNKIVFTVHWPADEGGAERWLGHNCYVEITPDKPPTMPATTKPVS